MASKLTPPKPKPAKAKKPKATKPKAAAKPARGIGDNVVIKQDELNPYLERMWSVDERKRAAMLPFKDDKDAISVEAAMALNVPKGAFTAIYSEYAAGRKAVDRQTAREEKNPDAAAAYERLAEAMGGSLGAYAFKCAEETRSE